MGAKRKTLAVELLGKLARREAHVAVIGVGNSGLPLAVAFAEQGYRVTGVDSDGARVASINGGLSYLRGVSSEVLGNLVRRGSLDASRDGDVLARADAAVVCVPTLRHETMALDLGSLLSAWALIAQHRHPGMVVVLESTAPPGTTSKLLVPQLTGPGLGLGTEMFVACSPQRAVPTAPEHGIRNTPKIVGGATPKCLEVAMALYRGVIEHLVPVSSATTAEMVKLIENSFKSVNVALADEWASMARAAGVDVWEAIRAASSKPFGFMPFHPSPGVGGPRRPSQSTSQHVPGLEHQGPLIQLAAEIQRAMPARVVARVQHALNGAERAVRGTRLLVVGVGNAHDAADTEGSPGVDIIDNLEDLGAQVDYLDPLVPELHETLHPRSSMPHDVPFGEYDCVVVVAPYASLELERLAREARHIIDTRNALHKLPAARGKVTKL
jgi:UDP-N-acetyl-D-glucosamine dehydrogenase